MVKGNGVSRWAGVLIARAEATAAKLASAFKSHPVTPGESHDTRAFIAGAARWIVPSTSILFIIAGYLTQTAQQDLLGIAVGSDDPRSLVITSADFLIDLLSMAPASIARKLDGGQIAHSGVAATLFWLTAVSVVLIVAQYGLPGRRRLRTLALLVWAVGLIVGKFLYIDEPLSQVKNVVTGYSSDLSDPRNYFGPRYDPVAAAATGGAGSSRAPSFSETRTEDLWRDIVCSHISSDDARVLTQPSAVKHECTIPAPRGYRPTPGADPSESYNKISRDGEYFTEVILTLNICAISCAMLFSENAGRVASFALLVFATGFFVPYSYGKLRKSMLFEASIIERRLPNALLSTPSQRLNAIQISDSDGRMRVLLDRLSDCSTGGRKEEVVSFAVPDSQVVDIDNIQREDIFHWALLKQSVCPPAPAPPPP